MTKLHFLGNVFKKKMACKGECRTRYLDASLTDRRETVMLVLGDLGVISSDLKCLLKTELEVLETKLKDFLLANLN